MPIEGEGEVAAAAAKNDPVNLNNAKAAVLEFQKSEKNHIFLRREFGMR